MMRPQAPYLSPNAIISACLLIKEDNEILDKCIAYYFHTVSLRFWVVAPVDPLSSQSPTDILQRWRHTTDLKVLEWTDKQHMPNEFFEDGYIPTEHLQNHLF
jgi:hypothetical protein